MATWNQPSVAPQEDRAKAAPQTSGDGLIESLSSAFVRGTIAGTIDDAERLAGVGQGDDQGMVAPGTVIGDVHALLTLAGGGDQGTVGIEDGLVEEANGLMLPNADANAVKDVLQGIDVGNGKASAEVTCGGGIGDALSAQSVEKVNVIAAQFDVLQTIAATQGIEGDVEHMVGLGVKAENLEDVKVLVDGVDQADITGQLVKKGNTAVADAMHTLGDFVSEIATGEHRAEMLGKLGFVESALDFALAGSELTA